MSAWTRPPVRGRRNGLAGSARAPALRDAIVVVADVFSGSPAFDRPRGARDRHLRAEAALVLDARRVNPTDRANRFGSGAAVEWILAAVAYAAEVVTLPGGHNSIGFDLRDLREEARGLRSVEKNKRGDWRITNGLGGAGGGFRDPTVFVSPTLPGLTLVDPEHHVDAASQAVVTADAVVLPARVVKEHARQTSRVCRVLRHAPQPGNRDGGPKNVLRG